MKSKVNLHVHTVHSDGSMTAEEVVRKLKTAGVGYFAVTDHDAVRGNIEAAKLAKKLGMKHTGGVELSCCFDGEIGFDESYVCHVLGLGVDVDKMQSELMHTEDTKDRLLQIGRAHV